MSTPKEIRGTREWAAHNVNCVTGCSHNCRYCYAREMAVRFGRSTVAGWPEMAVRAKEVQAPRRKLEGRVMFPTAHDITPAVLAPCRAVLANLLEAGNEVLIVTKPHLDVVVDLCASLRPHRDRVTWRFTIGATRDGVLSFWEPGAPRFSERLRALRHAFDAGYQTSVSSEPLLDWFEVELFGAMILPYVTDAWWIGLMNQIERRVIADTPREREVVEALARAQSEAGVRALFSRLKDEPKVKWKESIKKIVGLPLAKEPGEDE